MDPDQGKNPEKRIVRDTIIVFAVQAIARIANFVYFIFIAKELGATEFGYLNIVLSFVLVFDVIGDIGISRYVLRETAIDVVPARADVEALIPLRLLTAGAAYVVIVLLSWLFYETLVVQLTAVVALGLFFTGPAAIFEAVLQGRSKFTYISLAHAALTAVQVGSGVAVIAAGGGVLGLATTFVLTNLVFSSVVKIGVGRIGTPIRFRPNFARCRAIIPKAAPYAVIFGLFIFSSRLELLVLGWFESGEQLGLYGIAARMTDAALVVPLALGTVLSPNFTQFHHTWLDKLAILYARMLRLTLLFAIPGAIAAVELSEPVMAFLLSEKYAGVADLVRIMFSAYPFAAIYYLNLSLLLGSQNQLRTALLMGGLVVIQSLFSLLLIPAYGAQGAASAFCLTMICSSVVSTGFVRHWYVSRAPLLVAAAPALAGAVVLGVLVFRDGSAVGWTIDIVGIIAYAIIALYSMRRLKLNDPEPAIAAADDRVALSPSRDLSPKALGLWD